MKLNQFKLFAGILLTAVLFTFSCEKQEGDSSVIPEIEIPIDGLYAKGGEMFVSVKAGGHWSIQLNFGGQEPWAEVDPASGEGNKNNVVFSYKENKSKEPRTLEIELYSSGEKDVHQLIQEGASERKYVIKSSWMELPDMSDKDLDYIAHHYVRDGKKYRNYSIGYSEEDVVSVWVAYPLCGSHIGGLKRREYWQYDPVLGYKSPAPFGRYAGDMDRGHMLPSHSRSHCYEAMEQTYYGSNIAPQIGVKYNQGIWQKLEEKVQLKATTVDTLYVVTGCIVKENLGKTEEGLPKAENLLNPNDPYPERKQITVPSGFYKALLAYKKDSGKYEYQAAAYYLPHKEYSSNTINDSMRMTIDQLEEMTGLDFFPNLIKKIGKESAEKIEKENPTDFSL